MNEVISSQNKSIIDGIRQSIKSVCKTMQVDLVKIIDKDDILLNLRLMDGELNLDYIEIFELIQDLEDIYKINMWDIEGVYTVNDLFNKIEALTKIKTT